MLTRMDIWLAAGLAGLAAGGAEAEGAMIDPPTAREIARDALRAGLAAGDPLFAPWTALDVAAARLVFRVSGDPSYWTVPLVSNGTAVGFVRVMADGTVAAIGLTCRAPEDAGACPAPAFALSAAEVEAQIRDQWPLSPGETLSMPRLVHDGPPGREIWMGETRRDGNPGRWIFMGSAGSYERPAGTYVGADPEVE